MNYVNIKILPRPHNVEFKQVGKLIFDVNYVGYMFNSRWQSWLNSKGHLHRENGPASISPENNMWWYSYGKYQREWIYNGKHENGDQSQR